MRRTLLLALAFAAAIAMPRDNVVAKDKAEVAENDRLKFDQEKVAANMRELEDRMIKLADLLRDAKPDDSARLLLGVENAREELILEQMQMITKLLDDVDLSKATEEQKEVLAKLRHLKELLLNADLDLRIKLEQLKKIADAQKKLAELVAKEEQQKAATETAEQKNQDTKPIEKNERRNQKAGESLDQQLKKIAGSNNAAQSVQGACNSMGDAAGQLSQGQCNSACQSQQKAIDQLKQAQQELEELKKKVQQQAESEARQRVTELLNEMIERQTKIKEATVAAVPRMKQADAQIAGVLNRLASAEDVVIEAATECIEICDLTEFSFVLPAALRDVRDRMNDVRSDLDQAKADDQVVAAEEQIISDLKELLDAMKQAGKPGSPKIGKSNGGCCSNRNKLIAEVKMLYWMQKTVNRKTKKIREQELAGDLTGEALKSKTEEMMVQQDKIHEVTERLRELTNPGVVNGDAF